jgi:hypothetical protein
VVATTLAGREIQVGTVATAQLAVCREQSQANVGRRVMTDQSCLSERSQRIRYIEHEIAVLRERVDDFDASDAGS